MVRAQELDTPQEHAETAIRREVLGLPWYVWALMTAAVAIRLLFWVTTHRVWEDALITLAPVRNAFTSIGLTHHAGEGRVYSFTSPLSVLIPLTGEVLHRGAGLFALRLASLLTAPLAVLFTFLTCRRLEISLWPGLLAMAYVAADHEQVFFGMSGMETQVATTILLASVFLVLSGKDPWIGVSFGLAMLARPDFVLWVVPAVLYIFWRRGVRRVAWAVIPAAALYGPWLLFTQLYYGTVIPETIQAKAVVFSPVRLILGSGSLGPGDWLGNAIHLYGTDLVTFSPFYETGGISGAPLPLALGLALSLTIVVLAAQGGWRTRHVPGWPPVIAYVLLFLVYRVFFLGVTVSFGWYLPPFRAVVFLLAAAGFERLLVAFPRGAPTYAGALAVLFMVSSIMLFPLDARAQEIENQVRIQAGMYLGVHAGHQQSIVSESSGYVGYYSNSQLHDYPGLTSPLAYRTLSQAPPEDRSLVYLIYKLDPDWVVLRPVERTYFGDRYPATASHYLVAQFFQSNVELDVWGVHADDIDRQFYVLRRN
jgi:hypothetical protein